MKDFEKIIREKGLPEVGQEVRSKKYGTVWRVKEGERPGVGKMMGYEYTLYDNTFALNWDITA